MRAVADATAADQLGRRVGRGLGWSAVGNIVARLFNVVTSIVMARLIAPEEFAVFAVAFTVWVIVSTISEFGLSADLVRAPDFAARAPTIATLAMGLGLSVALAMVGSAPSVAAAFGSPASADVIRLMALSAVVMALATVPAAQMQREFRQAGLFVLNTLTGVTGTATIVILAENGVGAASLAWGQILGQVVFVAGLMVATRSRPRLGFDRAVARSSLAFCVPLAGANLLSWLLLTVDNVVVARVAGPVPLGLYVLAFNVSSWPMSAVGQALRSVALPAFAQLDGGRRRGAALVRATGPVVAVAGLLAMLLATLAAPLVDVLFGSRWAGASAALAGLAVFGGIRVVFDMVATFLIAMGTTTGVLVVQVVWLASMVPAMVWAVERHGLYGAGWAHVGVALAVVLPAYLVCLHRVQVDTRAFVVAWVRPVLGLAPATAACWWIGHRSADPLLLLLAGGLAATLLYALPMAPWWIRSIRSLRAPAGPPIPTYTPIGQDA